jgi:hypothetical protein
MKSRVMYMECKSGAATGQARIGLVLFSKTGSTLRYRDLEFISLKGRGFKANYLETGSGDEYWISGPRKDGQDRLYTSALPVEIDDEVRGEYWSHIRGLPEQKTRVRA